MMPKSILLPIILLVLTSCSNVAQYKETLDTLTNDWKATAGQIMTVIEQITQMQNTATTTLNAMSPSEEITAQMTEEQTATLNNLKQQVQVQIGALGEASKTAFEFVNKWQHGGEQLASLNDGISSGKLPENADNKIQELQEILTIGNANLENWTNQINTTKEVINTATQGYAGLMESFSKAVAE
jgi:hypothetical protein